MVLVYLGLEGFFYFFGVVEGLIFKLSERIESVMNDGETKFFCGRVHLFSSFFIFLFSINIRSLLPLIYPLSIHFIVTASFSVPFWLMRLLANLNINWMSFFAAQIHSSSENEGVLIAYGAGVIIVVSEIVRILVRPITLCARLRINLFIGQIITKGLTSVVLGLFYPFCYIDGVILFWRFVFVGLRVFYFIVELLVGTLQSIIFIGLCIFYLREVKVKVD